MTTRSRRAATAKQQRSGVLSDTAVGGRVTAGGILASLNVNIPVIKNLKVKGNDKVPSSVMVSRSFSDSTTQRLQSQNTNSTSQSFKQDADDDLSAISCDVSPQALDISLGASRTQRGRANFSVESTGSNDSASHDLTISLQASEDEPSEDTLSLPRSHEADFDTADSDDESSFTANEENSEFHFEASESILEESCDPGLDDDEYNPNEDDASDSDEDLEFMENEIDDSPGFKSRLPRSKDGDCVSEYITRGTDKAVPQARESDDDSTIVEQTPAPKSKRRSVSMMSPKIQLAEVVNEDEISDNDTLVATIIDGDQVTENLISSKIHQRIDGIDNSQEESDGMSRHQTDYTVFQHDRHVAKKGNILVNQRRKEHGTDSVEYYERSDTNETKPSPSLYHTPIQKKSKSRKKSFWLEGRVKRGKWTLGAKIGFGSFGVVHVGMNTLTGSLMAVKIFKVNGEAVMKDVRREVELMRSLEHQNIVQYLGAQMDKTHMHIFQEWVPGGSLASMLSRFGAFPLQVIQRYLSQTLLGLQYLHKNNIIHRDIKGSNILVNDEGVVKLADFGASKKLSNLQGDMMMSLTVRGTPYFMAPEVFEERYSSKADIWGIGCVAFQMITASPPWKDQGFTNPISLFNHIKRTSGPPPLPHSIAAKLSQEDLNLMNTFDMLMMKCFENEPSKRPSAQDLLTHDFFDEIGSDNDSLHTRLFSPDSHIHSPWSVKCKQTGECAIPFDSQCKAGTNGHPNHSNGSEIFSPQRDTSSWPEWAKDQFGKKERATPSSETTISNMMGSLALSEDSTAIQNPFASNVDSKSVLAGSSAFSNLLGLQLIDQMDNEG